MKRYLAALLAFVLLAGCGTRTLPPETQSAAPSQSAADTAPQSEAASSENEADAQAARDEALAETILLTYGAEHTTDRHGRPCIRTTPISMFFSDEGWDSAAELTARDYFSWFFSTKMNGTVEHDDASYLPPAGSVYLEFYPQDIYEGIIQHYFDVSSEVLRADPSYYDATNKGYGVAGGGGIGDLPVITIDRFARDGELFQVFLALRDSTRTVKSAITARLREEDNFRFERYEILETVDRLVTFEETTGRVVPASAERIVFPEPPATVGTEDELNAWYDAIDATDGGTLASLVACAQGDAEFTLSHGAIGAVIIYLQNPSPILLTTPPAAPFGKMLYWVAAFDKDEKLLWRVGFDGALFAVELDGKVRLYGGSDESSGMKNVVDYLENN